jgi:hypothetical protein
MTEKQFIEAFDLRKKPGRFLIASAALAIFGAKVAPYFIKDGKLSMPINPYHYWKIARHAFDLVRALVG